MLIYIVSRLSCSVSVAGSNLFHFFIYVCHAHTINPSAVSLLHEQSPDLGIPIDKVVPLE